MTTIVGDRKLLPLPKLHGPLYCFGSKEDAELVRAGDMLSTLGTKDLLKPPAGGFRLAAFGRLNEATSFELPGLQRDKKYDRAVFRLKLNRLDDIFVVDYVDYLLVYDNALRELPKRKFWQRHPRITKDQIEKAEAAKLKTLKPLSTYLEAPHFLLPHILIGRSLDFDEVELLLVHARH